MNKSLRLTFVLLCLFPCSLLWGSPSDSKAHDLARSLNRDLKAPALRALVALYSREIFGASEGRELEAWATEENVALPFELEKRLRAKMAGLLESIQYDPLAEFRSRLRAFIRNNGVHQMARLSYKEAARYARNQLQAPVLQFERAIDGLDPEAGEKRVESLRSIESRGAHEKSVQNLALRMEGDLDPLHQEFVAVRKNGKFPLWVKKNAEEILNTAMKKELVALLAMKSLRPDLEFDLVDPEKKDDEDGRNTTIDATELGKLIPAGRLDPDNNLFSYFTRPSNTSGKVYFLGVRSNSFHVYFSRHHRLLHYEEFVTLAFSDSERLIELLEIGKQVVHMRSSLNRLEILIGQEIFHEHPQKMLDKATEMGQTPTTLTSIGVGLQEITCLSAALRKPALWTKRFANLTWLGRLAYPIPAAVILTKWFLDAPANLVALFRKKGLSFRDKLHAWNNRNYVPKPAQPEKSASGSGSSGEFAQQNHQGGIWDFVLAMLVVFGIVAGVLAVLIGAFLLVVYPPVGVLKELFWPSLFLGVAVVGVSFAVSKFRTLIAANSDLRTFRYESPDDYRPKFLEVPGVSDLNEHPYEIRRFPLEVVIAGKPTATIRALKDQLPKFGTIVPIPRPLGHPLLAIAVHDSQGNLLSQGRQYDVLYVQERDSYFIRTRIARIRYVAMVEAKPSPALPVPGSFELSPAKRLEILARQYDQLGFYRLASSFFARAASGAAITTGEFGHLFASQNTYPLGDFTTLEDLPDALIGYQVFESSGGINGACTVANGAGAASARIIADDGVTAEVREVAPLNSNGETDFDAHCRTYFFKSGALVDWVDFSPFTLALALSEGKHRMPVSSERAIPLPQAFREYLTPDEQFERWAARYKYLLEPLVSDWEYIKTALSRGAGPDPRDPMARLYLLYARVKELMDSKSDVEDARVQLAKMGEVDTRSLSRGELLGLALKLIEQNAVSVEAFSARHHGRKTARALVHYEAVRVGRDWAEPMKDIASSFRDVAAKLETSACAHAVLGMKRGRN